jgi:hypothetical protein
MSSACSTIAALTISKLMLSFVVVLVVLLLLSPSLTSCAAILVPVRRLSLRPLL